MAPHSPQIRVADSSHDPRLDRLHHRHYNNSRSGSCNSSPYNDGRRHGPLNQHTSNAAKIKCVFVGDGAVGKTSLIVSYTTNGYPSEYVPTAIDTYDVVVNVNGEPVTFEINDTPGQSDFDTLRPLCYPGTDVFIICFSVVSPTSFMNVRDKWVCEIRKTQKKGAWSAKVPMVLVGTQSDLREDAPTLVELAKTKEMPVSETEAKKLASALGFECYVECSSLTQKNLKEVFDEAILAGLKGRQRKEKKKLKGESKQSQMCGKCSIL